MGLAMTSMSTFHYDGGPRDPAFSHPSCCGASDRPGSEETSSLTKYLSRANGLP